MHFQAMKLLEHTRTRCANHGATQHLGLSQTGGYALSMAVLIGTMLINHEILGFSQVSLSVSDPFASSIRTDGKDWPSPHIAISQRSLSTTGV